MILVAAFVTLADEPLYRSYAEGPRLFGLSPLADQIAGGVIMWVPGSLVYLLAMTVVYFRWVIDSEESPLTPPSPQRGEDNGERGCVRQSSGGPLGAV